MRRPPDKRTGGPPGPPVTDSPPPSRSSAPTVAPDGDSGGDLLALSDERDLWLNRLLAAERAAYQRGLADGRARACVALAQMEEHYAQMAWWREYSAKVQRIIQAETDPSARMRQVMAEIAADQRVAREARARRATKPLTLSPLELCVLRRIRFADPGDAAQWDAE